MNGGLDSFRRLQAQIGSQLAGSLDLPKVKAAAVHTVLAAVVAAGAIVATPNARANDAFPDGQPAPQQISPEWVSKQTAIGAGVGAAAGNLFGAFTGISRTATTAVGGIVGGIVGAVEGGKDKLAQTTQTLQKQAQAGQQGYPKLSAERDMQMATMMAKAVGERTEYMRALSTAKEAEIDKSLMPNDKGAQERYKEAVIAASKQLRLEREATAHFVGAFETMVGKYDVSQYSHAHAKLRQPVNFNDSSYGALSMYALDTLKSKVSGAEVSTNKNENVSNYSF